MLPGTGKNFDQFRGDDLVCRQFAEQQVNGATANQAGASSGVATAIVGTILGAAAGAAINGSSGAGVGAGTGLALGGLAGTGTAQGAAYSVQRRYDIGYQQCMYAKGHRIQSYGRSMTELRIPDYPVPSGPPGAVPRPQ
ncbi:hypothetical protein D3870_08630 [Noviherbaspirillum cavernae]|uniref:Glycine-zipper-containing OmpA-like membrane domain-containing protein n=1 Tax=Noviherbaspirillum cavernae TaxID=2320862 RepID=A0A418X122_9BURK|nr:hypothetical protein D3870_08630 [Noviherbaspirillum cavernae]